MHIRRCKSQECLLPPLTLSAQVIPYWSPAQNQMEENTLAE